ncbi:hypothetical protein [Yokenella regensburgei]|uniref:hypothetical protein n=1 Tax=Yokenella regensburgei TaxID=158877 RepID=UPI0011BDFF0C|nr:hypothetical protein [Yokenella regensburgei]
MEVPDREVMAVVEAQQQITAPAAAGAVVAGAMVAVLAQVQEPVAAAQAPVVVALVAGVEAAVPVVDQEAVQVAEAGHLRPRIMCSAIPDKPSAALVVRWMA